jgi:predicted glycoside hydrolase/deacetylase ChbG (UPF0249 family)
LTVHLLQVIAMADFSLPLPRPIVLCADDFGLAPGVSNAIAELIAAGRLSATSCMSNCGDWRRAAAMLRETVATHPADIGLHLTLTDHAPLSPARGLVSDGRLPPLSHLLPRALFRRLPAAAIHDELRAQLDVFEDIWGAPPDYIDGHQHVHLLPTVREAVVDEILRRYPAKRVWVRDCVEPAPRCAKRGVSVSKALFISQLGRGLRQLGREAGLPMNEGFSGLHEFSSGRSFRERMQAFLVGLGRRPLVHVHPGRVDAALLACDSLTSPREAELAYLAGDDFAADLAAAGVRLARFSELSASTSKASSANSGSIR